MTRLVICIMTLLMLPLNAWSAPFNATDQAALLTYGKSELLFRIAAAPRPVPPAIALQTQRACFVTFSSKQRVFACFGSFTPRRATLAEEISENIRLALKNDPRSAGLTIEQARDSDLQITFAGALERISDWRQIDPAREGLFVELSDGQGVAIVPGEARTAQYAWRSALKRLGVSENSKTTRLYRFTAIFISTRSANQQ